MPPLDRAPKNPHVASSMKYTFVPKPPLRGNGSGSWTSRSVLGPQLLRSLQLYSSQLHVFLYAFPGYVQFRRHHAVDVSEALRSE